MGYEFIEREDELEAQASSSRGGLPPRKITGVGVLDPPVPPRKPGADCSHSGILACERFCGDHFDWVVRQRSSGASASPLTGLNDSSLLGASVRRGLRCGSRRFRSATLLCLRGGLLLRSLRGCLG